MLPESYRQPYCLLQQTLQGLKRQNLEQLSAGDRATLKTQVQDLQALFQQQILTLDLEALDSAASAKLQSFQVEISKQLRLLNTDLMFLQAARLSATLDQRQNQIGDRLEMLLQYCEAVLAAQS